MSATNSTAIKGQSSHVSPLAAAIALAAIVAVGAVGVAISQGVGTSSAAAQAKAGPAVVTQSTMSGPRSVAQKGLVADQAAIAATKDADASVSLGTGIASTYGGSEFAGQYEAWLKGQQAAMANSFPDYWQRLAQPSNGVISGRISNQLRLPQ
jgi:hypothetical protein